MGSRKGKLSYNLVHECNSPRDRYPWCARHPVISPTSCEKNHGLGTLEEQSQSLPELHPQCTNEILEVSAAAGGHTYTFLEPMFKAPTPAFEPRDVPLRKHCIPALKLHPTKLNNIGPLKPVCEEEKNTESRDFERENIEEQR